MGKDEIICFEGEMCIGRQFEIMVDIAWQIVGGGDIKLRNVWMAGSAKRVCPSADCF